MSFNHITHPAITVVKPRPVMTLATFRFLTAAVSRGPADGPTSAADGPMNPTKRKAEPTQRTPATMWMNRKTSMNGSVAITHPPPVCVDGGTIDRVDSTRHRGFKRPARTRCPWLAGPYSNRRVQDEIARLYELTKDLGTASRKDSSSSSTAGELREEPG